jgi:hypothetical protein
VVDGDDLKGLPLASKAQQEGAATVLSTFSLRKKHAKMFVYVKKKLPRRMLFAQIQSSTKSAHSH